MQKQNALFNEKTIKRLCKDQTISVKQKKAAKEWLELLKNDALHNEKQNYLRFNRIILTDLLGYSDMEHEEGKVEFSYKNNKEILLKIEVKGSDTKDLFAKQTRVNPESPVEQLWRYLNAYATPYGIVTNYKQFILFKYSEGSNKCHVFDFKELEKDNETLKEFIAIFSKEGIESGFLEDLREKSVKEEREFTKEFYKLFHETRLMLIKEFKENAEFDDEVRTPVHFAQLYLNRLMFLFFAEDTDKVPKRLFERRILNMVDSATLTEHSYNVSSTISGLFESLNKGEKTPENVFGFNGGLFKAPIPPKIYFKDLRDKKFFKGVFQHSQLKKETELDEYSKKIISKYENKINPIIKNLLLMASFDFKTEVNVNILGHIFEQSISDVEELQQGETSRRKKEGIFYTPEYITEYICRNTIIPYLSKSETNDVNKLVLEHADDISILEKKFKELKILDPACGSGAFLLKAVDVLLEIHKEIQLLKQDKDLYTKKTKSRRKKVSVATSTKQIGLEKWHEEDEARKIIENNIFGVDINEESIEITKLSLFLKIARKNRKLMDLSSNIKCGNSLINDKEIDERAFDWEKEFPFKFDVVIGNPPYINAIELSKTLGSTVKKYWNNKFATAKGTYDIYILFFEQALNVCKDSGFVSFITPNKYLSSPYGFALREFIMKQNKLTNILDLSKVKVFDDPSVYPIITIINKMNVKSEYNIYTEKIFSENLEDKKTFRISSKNLSLFPNNLWGVILSNNVGLIQKIYKKSIPLEKVITVQATSTAAESDEFSNYVNEVSKGVKIINTGTIDRYSTTYGMTRFMNKGKQVFNPVLDISKINESRKKIYQSPKTIFAKLALRMEGFLDINGSYASINTNCIYSPKKNLMLEYITALMNSKLMSFVYSEIFSGLKMSGGYFQFQSPQLRVLPVIEKSSKEQKPLVRKVNSIVKLNEELNSKKQKFLRLLKSNFNIEKNSKKLNSFYELNFEEFKKELEKTTKSELSLKQQSEWMDLFDKSKKELLELKKQIDETDCEIDELVYKLYGITEKEKKIIEKSLK